MKVLITGGAGFIGSHLADSQLTKGNQVFILDSMATGAKSNISRLKGNFEFVEGDIRNTNLVNSLVKNCDLIFHMAAALGVANIMNNTLESISTNILGSEVILKAATENHKRIMIASTSEIYGKNLKQPLSEEDDRVIGTPQNIRWSYSDAKAIEESMARSLFLTRALPVTTVRFFNTVGPRQTGQYGMVLPRFIFSASRNLDIQVYGNGNQTRVFCHVADAIRGLELLSTDDSSIGEVFNIGGEEEVSINQLARRVIELTNSNSKIVNIPYDSVYPVGFEDMLRRVPDTSKIQKQNGWKAEFNLERIILDVFNFIKNEKFVD
jgi:UDP-glucose 4-epimerase